MLKLMKKDFDEKYRFRESRDKSVSCVTCDNMAGGTDDKERPAFCEHEERHRKIKIAEYWEGWGSGTSHNIAPKRVCDVYTSKPLPERVEKIILPKKHAILLGTQYRDQYHADPNCPYVMEELRMQKEGANKRAGVNIADLSEMVPGETIRTICEMPCCESKLPFQISMNDDYGRRVGIKPDGSEPTKWVRNGIVKHEKKVKMSPKELESVFDLERFNSPELGDIHEKIVAASDYLHENCNRLGSRLLSGAINPVEFSSYHHILEDSLVDFNGNADFWAYDERLFDSKKGLEKPIKDLEKIPEGLILCMDTKRIFRSAQFHCKEYSGRFWIYGILKSTDDENLLSKGVNHFIEIGAINYHGGHHMWGVFGKDFEELASFHEQ